MHYVGRNINIIIIMIKVASSPGSPQVFSACNIENLRGASGRGYVYYQSGPLLFTIPNHFSHFSNSDINFKSIRNCDSN